MPDEPVVTQKEMEALLDKDGQPEEQSSEEAPVTGVAMLLRQAPEDTETADVDRPYLDDANNSTAVSLAQLLLDVLDLEATVQVAGTQLSAYDEFECALAANACLETFDITPGGETGFFSVDPSLAHVAVDKFFGGKGEPLADSAGQPVTATARRVVRHLLEGLQTALGEAWRPHMALEFSLLKPDPQREPPATDSKVVISTFTADWVHSSGELKIALTTSLLDAVREQRNLRINSPPKKQSQTWGKDLKGRIDDVNVELSSIFGEVELDLTELLRLQPGDFIPMKIQRVVQVCVQGVPLFDATVGVSNGFAAAKITSRRVDKRASSQNRAGV